MSELLLIVGNSGAGKDWLAENKFKNFTLLKLNQAFKDIFEQDHLLEPGECNNKACRQNIIKSGPMSGKTIQEGMISAYQQSLSGYGYGAKFATTTILAALSALENFSKNRTPVVITDLRKESELVFILEFAKLIHYYPRMIHISSDKEKAFLSDESLMDNIGLYQAITKNKVEHVWNSIP